MELFYLEDFKKRLEAYPQIGWRECRGCIYVDPKSETNFEVAVCINDFTSAIFCEGWRRDLDDLEDLFKCFLFVLSPQARLKVDSKGSKDFRWALQSRKGDEWVTESKKGALFYPFWKKMITRYLQNEYDF